MEVLLGILAAVFLLLSLYEHRRYKTQAAEIEEASGQLAEIMGQNGYRVLLIPSSNRAVKELAGTINRLLESEYIARTGHERTRQNIQTALTNISHDLKTPLTVMMGYLEMLQLQLGKNSIENSGPESVLSIVAKIQAKTQDVTGMVNQFFDIARLESGDIVLESKKQYLSGICREVMLDYYDLLQQEGYTTEIEIPESPIYVMADAEGLKRILKNLVDNAMKHGGERKYLGLRLEEADGMAMVMVEDHGKGLTAAEAELIFDRNYIGSATHGASTGLGLSIAKKLAQRMNGELEAESIPGVRTVFTFRIPKL